MGQQGHIAVSEELFAHLVERVISTVTPDNYYETERLMAGMRAAGRDAMAARKEKGHGTQQRDDDSDQEQVGGARPDRLEQPAQDGLATDRD
ncbi:MAG: hypothetical protein AB7F99_09490 [Vicinamibacterales bacterium]